MNGCSIMLLPAHRLRTFGAFLAALSMLLFAPSAQAQVSDLGNAGGQVLRSAGELHHDLQPSKLQALGSDSFCRWYRLTYCGCQGDIVPSLLVVPHGASATKRVACLLLVHPLGGRKEIMLPIARLAAQDGYASLIIDLPGFGERGSGQIPSFNTAGKFADYIQATFETSVNDLRAGLDYLDVRKDIVDPTRIGLVGVSLGGIIGCDVTGLDKRIKMAALIASGGGLGEIIAYQAKVRPEYNATLVGLIQQTSAGDIDQRLKCVDPLTYVASIAPRPLLMENGTDDNVVPPSAAKSLFERAGSPKEIDWFPGEGHIPSALGLYASLSVFLRKTLPAGSEK